MASVEPDATAGPAHQGQRAQVRVYGFLSGTALSDVKTRVENTLLYLSLPHRSYQVTPSLAADNMPIATVIFERPEAASLAQYMLDGMQYGEVQLQAVWEGAAPGLDSPQLHQYAQWLTTLPRMTPPRHITQDAPQDAPFYFSPDRTSLSDRSCFWHRDNPDTIHADDEVDAIKTYKCSGPVARMLEEQFANRDEAEVFSQEAVFHISADRLVPVPLKCFSDPNQLLNAVRRCVQDMTPTRLCTRGLIAVEVEFVSGSERQPNSVMLQVSVLTNECIAASRLESRLNNLWNTSLIEFPQELGPVVENWARDYMQANYCYMAPVTDHESGMQQLLVCCCHQETLEEACYTFFSEVLDRHLAFAQDMTPWAAEEPHATQSALQTAAESSTSPAAQSATQAAAVSSTSHAAQSTLPTAAESSTPQAAASTAAGSSTSHAAQAATPTAAESSTSQAAQAATPIAAESSTSHAPQSATPIAAESHHTQPALLTTAVSRTPHAALTATPTATESGTPHAALPTAAEGSIPQPAQAAMATAAESSTPQAAQSAMPIAAESHTRQPALSRAAESHTPRAAQDTMLTASEAVQSHAAQQAHVSRAQQAQHAQQVTSSNADAAGSQAAEASQSAVEWGFQCSTEGGVDIYDEATASRLEEQYQTWRSLPLWLWQSSVQRYCTVSYTTGQHYRVDFFRMQQQKSDTKVTMSLLRRVT